MNLLKARRLALGSTQFELASKARVHPSTVSQLESGVLRPNSTSAPLRRLAQALGWTGLPEELLKEVG